MLFGEHLTIIRGGGDLATGVAYRLHQAGFPLIVLELPRPLVVRRKVALATAVLEGEVHIENLHGRLVHSTTEAKTLACTSTIPILTAPTLSPLISNLQSHIPGSSISILLDARMAKRNIDTHKEQAPLVIALGPGFIAGVDCHAVIETKRGHTLGRVIWQGQALPNTGTPGIIAGKGAERVLRAPKDGTVDWRVEIGDWVRVGEVMGQVNESLITAPFDGVVRGLIAPGTTVQTRLKIGDVDARGDRASCFTISDKALTIGGGVLEAVLTYLNQMKERGT